MNPRLDSARAGSRAWHRTCLVRFERGADGRLPLDSGAEPMEPESLLVIDDDPLFCRLAEVLLAGHGYRVVTETDPRKTLTLLQGGDFDVVLVDLVMPELGGLELISQIREHWNVLPILVVTAHGSVETTLEAMRRGATDFVTKPVDAPLLDLRIRGAYDLERTRRLANTDGLTGLYNHRFLQERLDQEIERSDRYDRPLSLVMADLDHFKDFNDTYGHPRGDQALIAVARTLRQVSRSSDVVARYGGEEFTLLLPETALVEGWVLAERARQCVEALRTQVGSALTGRRMTLSLGLAPFSPGTTKAALIQEADAALYLAKRQGRNRVCVGQAPAAGPKRRAEAARNQRRGQRSRARRLRLPAALPAPLRLVQSDEP